MCVWVSPVGLGGPSDSLRGGRVYGTSRRHTDVDAPRPVGPPGSGRQPAPPPTGDGGRRPVPTDPCPGLRTSSATNGPFFSPSLVPVKNL